MQEISIRTDYHVSVVHFYCHTVLDRFTPDYEEKTSHCQLLFKCYSNDNGYNILSGISLDNILINKMPPLGPVVKTRIPPAYH